MSTNTVRITLYSGKIVKDVKKFSKDTLDTIKKVLKNDDGNDLGIGDEDVYINCADELDERGHGTDIEINISSKSFTPTERCVPLFNELEIFDEALITTTYYMDDSEESIYWTKNTKKLNDMFNEKEPSFFKIAQNEDKYLELQLELIGDIDESTKEELQDEDGVWDAGCLEDYMDANVDDWRYTIQEKFDVAFSDAVYDLKSNDFYTFKKMNI